MPDVERLHDGELVATRDAPVGGQAVLEGVMMRGVSTWAVAVRKPAPEQIAEHHGEPLDPTEAAHGEIAVETFPLVSVMKKHPVLRWPIVRRYSAITSRATIFKKSLRNSRSWPTRRRKFTTPILPRSLKNK